MQTITVEQFREEVEARLADGRLTQTQVDRARRNSQRHPSEWPAKRLTNVAVQLLAQARPGRRGAVQRATARYLLGVLASQCRN